VAYDPNNVFAKIARGELPAIRVYEDEHTLAILDIMPQTDGHTLVLPKLAGENLLDTPIEHALAAVTTAQKVGRAIKEAMQAPGLVLTQFNAAIAGQTVFHLHFHLIPVYVAGSWRMHAREPADPARLEEHARRIRAALKG
jgi:histidine triad (HIT) family protein